jgi:uncharacterized protein YceK
MNKIALSLLLTGAVLVSGCVAVSPETTRTRGDGPGADVGNRRETVSLHEGSAPFWKTPDRIPGEQHPSLAPARQAQQLSR